MLRDDTRLRTAQDLAQRMRQIEVSGRQPLHAAVDVCSTGISPLDRLIPSGGIRTGTLVEWLSQAHGSGASTLAMLVASRIAQNSGELIVVDPRRQWYSPALEGLGVNLSRTIFVRPASHQKVLWAMEQALRCSGVKVVVCEVGAMEDKAYRRLQLAAEAGGTIGLLLRNQRFYQQPSWAELRLAVTPQARATTSESQLLRALRVHLLHARGRFRGGVVNLELDEQTGAVVEANDRPKAIQRESAQRVTSS